MSVSDHDEERVRRIGDGEGNSSLSSESVKASQDSEEFVPTEHDILNYVAVGKPMSPSPSDERDYEISWLGDNDPGFPTNFSWGRKMYTLVVCAMAALTTALGSAVIGPGIEEIMRSYHVGLPVATLNISLYVLGFALGPMVWGPMSELKGRAIVIRTGLLALTIFAFASASAANFQTLVLCRFFAGIFGAAEVTVAPSMIADLFVTSRRGIAIAAVSLMIFAGPMMAPVIGGYIASSFLGWRWTQYIFGIMTALVLVMSLFLQESYAPQLLANRAQAIREKTDHWTIYAPLERISLDTRDLLKSTVLKPVRMLAVEPILLLISIYHGFIYGILYLCLEAVPIIFTDYGWKGGNAYLPYLGMFVGSLIAGFSIIFIFEPSFRRKLAASSQPTIPEERLPMMMLAGISFPVGIFLLCWSGAYRVMWFVPTLGCFFIGFGLLGLFLPAFNYIIDSYLAMSATAMAANTFLRSSFGCAFPLFVHPMFINLGTQWAGTLLGCLASLLAPIPFFFYFYGGQIRKRSKFAVNFEALEAQLTRRSSHATVP